MVLTPPVKYDTFIVTQCHSDTRYKAYTLSLCVPSAGQELPALFHSVVLNPLVKYGTFIVTRYHPDTKYKTYTFSLGATQYRSNQCTLQYEAGDKISILHKFAVSNIAPIKVRSTSLYGKSMPT